MDIFRMLERFFHFLQGETGFATDKVIAMEVLIISGEFRGEITS